MVEKNDRWEVCGGRRNGLLSFDHAGTSDAAVTVSLFKRGMGSADGESRDCGVALEIVEGYIGTILPELLTTTRR
jgi:hypothetical protein